MLSDEGKALSKTDKAEQTAKDADKSFADKVESFAYGTLGLDHPDEVKAETDDSYTAGQYLKGALTVGGLLLATFHTYTFLLPPKNKYNLCLLRS